MEKKLFSFQLYKNASWNKFIRYYPQEKCKDILVLFKEGKKQNDKIVSVQEIELYLISVE